MATYRRYLCATIPSIVVSSSGSENAFFPFPCENVMCSRGEAIQQRTAQRKKGYASLHAYPKDSMQIHSNLFF